MTFGQRVMRSRKAVIERVWLFDEDAIHARFLF
jgi:hypothetical protein